MFTLATWNINSIRLREGLVARLLQEEAPDILCLQECKSPVDKIPLEMFRGLGYRHIVARGQKGYNGVAILSRLPIEDAGDRDYAGLGHARHVAARLPSGIVIHNFYVPAGGDIPDREQNVKFGQKLDFLTEMRDVFHADRPERSIMVGDLNIAPREDDVWSHKALLKIVSHTPIEVEHLGAAQDAGGWVDITRQDIPDGPLYSWWSYRAAIGTQQTRGGVWITSGPLLTLPILVMVAAFCGPRGAGKSQAIMCLFSRLSTSIHDRTGVKRNCLLAHRRPKPYIRSDASTNMGSPSCC